MPGKSNKTKRLIATHGGSLRLLLYLAGFALLAGLLLSQLNDLSIALTAARSVSPLYLLVGSAAMLGSVACTAAVYVLLTPTALPLGSTVLVQAAGLFVNKLVPSGSGAAGVSYVYLRVRRVKRIQAAAVVVLNNLLGFVGHVVLLAVLLAADRSNAAQPLLRAGCQLLERVPLFVWGLAVLLLFGSVGLLAKNGVQRQLQDALRQLVMLGRRPKQAAGALGISILLTACYAVSLGLAGRAAGVTLGPAAVMCVLTLSVAATVVLPVPGGVGAAEAGVFVALVAYAVPAPAALLTALVFRIITFWLPLLYGAVAFWAVQKAGLLQGRTIGFRH